jgi:predicted protein tyrosine phosphatase
MGYHANCDFMGGYTKNGAETGDPIELSMKKALFICSRNRLRSPTAERIFAALSNVETDSAGLAPDADTPLSTEQIEWADIIFVMEKAHRNRLSKQFGWAIKGKRIICLNIPDDYAFMAPELIRLLETKAGRFLR